ncbi:MAG: VWA domain-containing protein [Myxococcales bacterium]|nr:VWA domain-containing protein [Myxococcales bacterium]
MFLDFLVNLRSQGVPVGLGEWTTFMDALHSDLIGAPDELHAIGRAILCRTEADFDRYDLAFAHTFGGAVLDEETRERIEAWVRDAVGAEGERVDPGIRDEDLWKELLKRIAEQKERHEGGSRWVGTGGTSPFGNSGRSSRGIRVGGSGGGRSAIQVASDRRWEEYRTDRTIDIRDLEVSLRLLRTLIREGDLELDLKGTIRRTADNAGDIEIVEHRARVNQVHLVLMMDAGGSMAPHYELVSRLFSAASRTRGFKSFKSYQFHNCVYGWLYEGDGERERVATEKVLAAFGPRHRLILVGDASMAPYELFSPYSWPGNDTPSGLDWLKRVKSAAPGSVWLNPDPKRWWQHPTVEAIGALFPMYELTVEGLRAAIRKLRAPPVA